MSIVLATRQHHRPRPRGPVTDRERQVLALVADGFSNTRIATRLGLSSHTVKAHLAHAATKLGTGDRAGMVAVGFRQGWLS